MSRISTKVEISSKAVFSKHDSPDTPLTARELSGLAYKCSSKDDLR